MAIFKGLSAEEAARNPVVMRQFLDKVAGSLQGIHDKLGIGQTGMVDDPNNPKTPYSAPPQNPQLSVTGADGEFLVQIVAPQDIKALSVRQRIAQGNTDWNYKRAIIWYELSTSTNKQFDIVGNVKTYPLTSDTRFDIRDFPNQSRYWRVRGSFDGKTFGDYVYSGGGPTLIYSGLLRSTSNDLVNSALQTTDGSNPLSNDGLSTTIVIATKNYNAGNQVINYIGGTTDPGSFGKKYVYLDDTKRAGGTFTWHSTTNPGDLTMAGRVYVGFITTVNGSGSAGSGGGNGGGCKVFGTLITRMDGTKTAIELLRRGDTIKGIDGGPEMLQADPAMTVQPCVKFTTATGRTMAGCSTTDLVGYDGGGYDKAENFIVTDRISTDFGAEVITSRLSLGFVPVLGLELDRTKTFIADGFYSHNNKIL